jgi:hypothetical protein
MMRMKTLFRPLLDHHDRGISPHWSCDESEKALSSVDITSFLVCARVVHMFTCLLVHICLYMTYTNVILPNMRVATFLPTQTL